MAEVMKTEEKEMPRAVMPGSVLTIEVDSSVESSQEKEEARWHQLLNAQRTRKILTGPLSGIEKLESGWMVAVTYFNGYRIIIPMSEMMINLKGDGRENADTLNRQVRIANNMLVRILILSSKIWMRRPEVWWLPERMQCLGNARSSIFPIMRKNSR